MDEDEDEGEDEEDNEDKEGGGIRLRLMTLLLQPQEQEAPGAAATKQSDPAAAIDLEDAAVRRAGQMLLRAYKRFVARRQAAEYALQQRCAKEEAEQRAQGKPDALAQARGWRTWDEMASFQREQDVADSLNGEGCGAPALATPGRRNGAMLPRPRARP